MNYRVPTAKVITKPWENLPTSYRMYWHYVLLKILCPYLLINTVEIFVDETMNCRLWSDSSHPKQCKLTVKTLNNMTLYVNVITNLQECICESLLVVVHSVTYVQLWHIRCYNSTPHVLLCYCTEFFRVQNLYTYFKTIFCTFFIFYNSLILKWSKIKTSNF